MSKKDKNKQLLIQYLNTKDKTVYDELFMSNINLVYLTLRKYIHVENKKYEDLVDDYFSLGCLGLDKAIKNFDLGRIQEVQFSTYAVNCIFNEIRKELKKEAIDAQHTVFFSEQVSNDTDDLTYEETIKDETYRPDDIVIDLLHKDYVKLSINNALNKLDEPAKSIIEYSFGLNNKEMKTQQEIADMVDLSQAQISRILTKVLEYLKIELSELDEEKKEFVIKTTNFNGILKDKSNQKNRYKQLVEKYGEELVIRAIRRMDDIEKDIIIMANGLDNTPAKSLKEIAKELNMEEKGIIPKYDKACSHLIKILNLLQDKSKITKLDELYNKYGYKKVNDAINSTSERNKQIIRLHNGIGNGKQKTPEQICSILKIDSKNPSSIIYMVYKRLETFITNDKVTQTKINSFYDKYGKDKVNDALNSLDDINKQIIILANGLDGNGIRYPKEICKLLNIETTTPSYYLTTAYRKLETNCKETKTFKRKGKDLQELYEKYGKQKVTDSIKMLDDSEITILSLFYGIKDNQPKTYTQIGNILDLNQNQVKAKLLNSKNKLMRLLNNTNKKNLNRKSDLDALIEQYGKDKVELSIKQLSKNNRKILELISVSESITNKEITKELNLSSSNISTMVYNAFKSLKKILESNKLEKSKLELLYDKYGKELVNECILKLNEQEKLLIKLHSENNYTSKEICNILNIKTNHPYNYIASVYKKLETKINSKPKKSKLDELIKEHGAIKVNNAIKLLDERDKRIIYLHNGLEDNTFYSYKQICEKLNILPIKANITTTTYTKLEKILKRKKDKETKLDHLYEKYGESKINSLLYDLSETEQEIIRMHNGLTDGIFYNPKEIYKLLCIETSNANYQVFSIYKKLEEKLNEPISEPIDKQILINLYNKYEKSVVTATISKLESMDRQIINMANYSSCKTNWDICKLLNIETKNPDRCVKEVYMRLEEMILNNKIEKYKSKIDSYNKEDLEFAISHINSENEELILSYHGIHSKKASIKKLSEKFNRSINEITLTIIKEQEHIILYLDKLIEDRKQNKEKLYNKLITKDENLIQEAISSLDKKQQEIIRMYFSYQGYDSSNLKTLSQKLNIDEYYLKLIVKQIITNVNREIEDLQDEKLTSEELNLKRKRNLALSLTEKARGRFNYLLTKLSKKELRFINLYLGINTHPHTINDISKELKLTKDATRDYLFVTINKINNLSKSIR